MGQLANALSPLLRAHDGALTCSASIRDRDGSLLAGIPLVGALKRFFEIGADCAAVAAALGMP